MRIFFVLFGLSWLALPCLAKNQEVNTERYIDGLDHDDLRTILDLKPDPWRSVEEGHLARLLIPRASGSQNNTDVRNYMKDIFVKLGWHTEETAFTSKTPIGDITFTNLIATFDPEAPTKLVLSAHFDSKHYDTYPANQFIGATDSAAPCSTLLDVAESLTPLLRHKQTLVQADEYEGDEEWAHTTLQIVLFDGEEAFHDWTATDSIYGARHLAQRWESTYLPDTHAYHTSYLSTRRYDPTPSILSTIEHLVLLDLLGAADPHISSYSKRTHWLFKHLADVEDRLEELSREGLPNKGKGKGKWFEGFGWAGAIDDDHRPFLERGVSILHLIANPFPRVWHTLGDDASVLDMPTLRKWNALMRIFTVEYLGLPVPSSSSGEVERSAVIGMAARTVDLVSVSGGRQFCSARSVKKECVLNRSLCYFAGGYALGYVVAKLVRMALVVIGRDMSIS